MNRLRELADNHPWAFWIGSLLVFMVLGYKSFELAFLGKTPYTWDVSFLKLALALLVILMLMGIYRGAFILHFRGANTARGFMLGGAIWLMLAYNLYGNIAAAPLDAEATLMVFVESMVTGFYEEVLMRGFLVNHMMRHWKGNPHRILNTLLASSVLFGVLHLGNVFSAGLVSTLIQVAYATCLGLAFAAVYLRTQNMWSIIIMHGLVDFSGSLSSCYVPVGQTPTEGLFSMSVETMLLLMLAMCVLAIVQAVVMVGKRHEAELNRDWA